MGRSYTPKYRIEMVVDNESKTFQTIAWDKRYGRTTKENLAKVIRSIETSMRPGGCNAHLTPVSYFSATIVNQSTGELVAFYTIQK